MKKRKYRKKPRFALIGFVITVVTFIVFLILGKGIIEDEIHLTVILTVMPLGAFGWLIDVIIVGEVYLGPSAGRWIRRADSPILFWAIWSWPLIVACGIWMIAAYRWLH